jgi:hypothetical protein
MQHYTLRELYENSVDAYALLMREIPKSATTIYNTGKQTQPHTPNQQ